MQRWNAIRPDRSVRAWTNDEDAHLLAFQKENGNRWLDCAKSVSDDLIGQGSVPGRRKPKQSAHHF